MLNCKQADLSAIYGKKWILYFISNAKDVTQLDFKRAMEVKRLAKFQYGSLDRPALSSADNIC